jgi:hypothetical protein
MIAHAVHTLCICVLLLIAPTVHSKGADGVVILKGVVQNAVASNEMLTLDFTGDLTFTFFTAVRGDPSRRQIDLKFDAHKLDVQIPFFGEVRGSSHNPFVVNFANAVRHAAKASETGEAVTVALFNPVLSFNINGVIEKAGCTHAQVMPDSVERRLRQ